MATMLRTSRAMHIRLVAVIALSLAILAQPVPSGARSEWCNGYYFKDLPVRLTVYSCGAIGKNSSFVSGYTTMGYSAAVGQYAYRTKAELVDKKGRAVAGEAFGQAEIGAVDGVFKARCSNISGKNNTLQCGYI